MLRVVSVPLQDKGQHITINRTELDHKQQYDQNRLQSQETRPQSIFNREVNRPGSRLHWCQMVPLAAL